MMLQQSDHNLPTNVHPRMLSVAIVAGLFAEVVAVIIYHPFPYYARRNDVNLIFHRTTGTGSTVIIRSILLCCCY